VQRLTSTIKEES